MEESQSWVHHPNPSLQRWIESFNMPVISVPQEAQRERCSLLQCGAQRPTALSITLTEASALSVPLWHPPQSTERMMNAPSTPTSQSEHTLSLELSLSSCLSLYHSLTLSLASNKILSHYLARSLSLWSVPFFRPWATYFPFLCLLAL